MTVEELIKVLKKCPKTAKVYAHYEGWDMEIGNDYSPVFTDIDGDVCVFCDVDEAPFVKAYIAKQITDFSSLTAED